MDNKLVMISIAAVIGIIVLGSVLMPILDDAMTVNETFTNEGYYRMSELTSETDTTIIWDHTEPYQITVGSDVISLSSVSNNQPVTIYGTDKVVVRYENRGDAGVVMQSFEGDTYLAVSTSAGVDMTLTVSGYVLNGTFGTTVADEITSTKGFIADPDGDYIMKNKDKPAYILGGDDFALMGVTLWGDYRAGIYADGSIDDGLTISTVYLYNVTTATYGDVTITDSAVNGFNDLYSLSSCAFDINTDGTDRAVTYSYFVVPYEVTAERSVHFTAGQNAILSAMPVMIILAVLLGVVALVIRSRMD